MTNPLVLILYVGAKCFFGGSFVWSDILFISPLKVIIKSNCVYVAELYSH